MSRYRYWTPEEWKKNRRKGPSLHALSSMEANALHRISIRPRLPQNERVANEMIRNVGLAIKLRAFFYVLFWLTLVPAVPALLASIIALICGCYLFTAGCLFMVVFLSLFVMKGVLGNVQKRLYVAYCLGFRGTRTALIMGWDGHEYEPDFGCYYWRGW
jgi:hypothetical protein